jgi:hypothetical protein
MVEELKKMISDKCPGAKSLLLTIRGSHAYGTNIETSDVDYAGVFIQSMDDILGNKYVEQINDKSNDIVIYEIKRFLELLATNNPNILELLNTPKDCILYKDNSFDAILDNAESFITKACANSFGGYAIQQIKKAKGQDKKQNWEVDRVSRKDILDFVKILDLGKSLPIKKYFKDKSLDYSKCGVSSIPNAKGVYNLFYGEGYKGIVKFNSDGEVISNELKLSSIPKGEAPLINIVFNKEGYQMHCKDYNSYKTWLDERNMARWVDVKGHGQKIDGKNMMHCKRLIEMAIEIGQGKGINVRRSNASELIDIRKGKVNLETLINDSEDSIKLLNEVFENSDLPKSLDMNEIHKLLVRMRKEAYRI